MAHVYADGQFLIEQLSVDHRIWYDTDSSAATVPSALASDERYLERWLDRMNGSGPVIIAHNLDDIVKQVYDDDGKFISGLLVDTLYDDVDSKQSKSHITYFYKAEYPYNFMVYCSLARRNTRTTYADRCQPVVKFQAQPQSSAAYKYRKKMVCDACTFTWHSPLAVPAFNFVSPRRLSQETLGFSDGSTFNLTVAVMGRMMMDVILMCRSHIAKFRQFCIDRPSSTDPRYWDGGDRYLPTVSVSTYGADTGKTEPSHEIREVTPNPTMHKWWSDYCNGNSELPPHARLAFATAYRVALERIDLGYVPLVSYAFDLFDMLKGKPRAKNIVKDARACYSAIKDMWLKYRYAYSTTKADVQELIELSDYLLAIGQAQDRLISSSGEYTDEHGMTFRVSFELSPQELIPKGKLDALIKHVGVIGPYEVWDLIPFSFIVDWFTNIGGLLESFERWNERVKLTPTNIWFTCQYRDAHADTFFRIRGYKSSEYGYIVDEEVSGMTIFKRIIDGVCLFSR